MRSPLVVCGWIMRDAVKAGKFSLSYCRYAPASSYQIYLPSPDPLKRLLRVHIPTRWGMREMEKLMKILFTSVPRMARWWSGCTLPCLCIIITAN